VQRQVYGLGSVWQDEYYDDCVGVFRWNLAVNQGDDGNLSYYLKTNQAYAGSDGDQSFIADIKFGNFQWTDDAGTSGELAEVACVTHAGGANAEWTLSGGMDSEGKGNVGVSWKMGYPDKLAKWEARLFVIPSSEGCPTINILNNQAYVSHSGYYWGSFIPRGGIPEGLGENDVNRQFPEVAISPADCYPFADTYMTYSHIPLPEEVENVTFDFATEI